jgi:hypothetical protein
MDLLGLDVLHQKSTRGTKGPRQYGIKEMVLVKFVVVQGLVVRMPTQLRLTENILETGRDQTK